MTRRDIRYKVTPKQAKEWLENAATNRKVSEALWERYAFDMLDGKWHDIGDPLRFDTSGRLIDGQHRLTAVVESDTTQEFDIIWDVPADALSVIDIGRKRTPGDAFGIAGYPNSHVAAAIASLLWRIERDRPMDQVLVNNERLLDLADRDPDRMRWAARMAQRARAVPCIGSAFGAFAYLLAERHGEEVAESFLLDKLAEGVGLALGDPAQALRTWFIMRVHKKQRVPALDQLHALVRAWNLTKARRSARQWQPVRGPITRESFEIK